MYAGRIVEQGPTEEIFRSPQHPYTWSLLRSIPRIDEKLGGSCSPSRDCRPDLTNLPPGCKFHPRCRFTVDRCSPRSRSSHGRPQHESRCWVQMRNVPDPDFDLRETPLVPGGRKDRCSQPETAAPASAWTAEADSLVSLRDVYKTFPSGRQAVRAVDGVTLDILQGETLGLVGESGCGKSTLGRVVTQLQPATAGSIFFEGKDLAALHGEDLRQMRRRVQMIFQDPYGSLNPRMTVGNIIGEPLANFGLAKGKERDAQVQEVMRICGLNPNFNNRYPHEFSGGQRQRIGIARSLILRPSFIVADEPISALDVSIQAQIINLLEQLQDDFALTYLFIAHDLSVVRHLSDRVAVMYLGVIVEVADSLELYDNPLHPYTTALLQSIPVPDPVVERDRKPIILKVRSPRRSTRPAPAASTRAARSRNRSARRCVPTSSTTATDTSPRAISPASCRDRWRRRSPRRAPRRCAPRSRASSTSPAATGPSPSPRSRVSSHRFTGWSRSTT